MRIRSVAALLLITQRPIVRADELSASVDKIEELSLEQLLEKPIVAASNVEQRPADSPTVVSVIEGDDFRRLGVHDLGSALASMRGVYATNDRNYSYLGIRGFSIPGDYNTRLLLTIDDHKITDPVYGQAMTGSELGLPLGAIQRVELVRGAASSTYGSSALLGAIHIVTNTGATRPGLHVESTTTSTAETYSDPSQRPEVAFYGEQVSATYGVVSGHTDVFVAASYLRAPGLRAMYTPEFANPNETCVDTRYRQVACDGIVRDMDHEEIGSAYFAIRHDDFRLSGLVSRRFKQVPTASFGTVIGDPDTHTIDSRIYLDGGYHKAFGDLELDSRVAYDHYGYHGAYVYYAPPDSGDPSYLAGRSVFHDASISSTFTTDTRLRWRRAELVDGVTDVDTVAGGEVVYAPQAEQLTADGRRDDHEVTAAGYGQVEARVAGRVVVSAGSRVDFQPSSYGANTSSRLGILVDVWREGRARFSYGTAFRAPTLYERYYYSEQAAEPALRPERSRTAEVSLEQYLGDHLRVIGAAYHNELSDLIELVALPNPGDPTNPSYVVRNGGAATGNGVEAGIDARWPSAQVRANVAIQRAVDSDGASDDGMDLPNSPHVLGNVSLVVPVASNRALLAVASSFIGRRHSAQGTDIAPAFTTDLAVEIPRVGGSQLDLGFGASNIFDQRSSAPGSEEHRQAAIPRDPRLVWIRIGASL